MRFGIQLKIERLVPIGMTQLIKNLFAMQSRKPGALTSIMLPL